MSEAVMQVLIVAGVWTITGAVVYAVAIRLYKSNLNR